MRIAYDHQIFCLQNTGGIARYYCRLAEQLDSLGQNVGVFAPIYRNQYLRALPQELVHGSHVSDYWRKTAGLMVNVNGLVSRLQMKQWQPDIVHETYFSAVRSAARKTPSVLTVFDMIGELGSLSGGGSAPPVKHTNFRATPKYAAVARADKVICISEHTRSDLIALFGVSPDKVSVVYLGCDGLTADNAPDDPLVSERRPFLLYVGLRGGYKNFATMLLGIATSTNLMSTFDVVAFGGGEFSADEQVLIERLGFSPGQVTQFSGNDRVLAQHYQTATALIYPSTYEGFGLPPVEAMSLGCPVVCSNRSSIPEVVGDAGEYFEPDQAETIASAIECVVFSPEKRRALIVKGLTRAQSFTWQMCAEQHLNVYQELLDA
jgi:glycosyltransferase involved in cell wall biosynthesis